MLQLTRAASSACSEGAPSSEHVVLEQILTRAKPRNAWLESLSRRMNAARRLVGICSRAHRLCARSARGAPSLQAEDAARVSCSTRHRVRQAAAQGRPKAIGAPALFLASHAARVTDSASVCFAALKDGFHRRRARVAHPSKGEEPTATSNGAHLPQRARALACCKPAARPTLH